MRSIKSALSLAAALAAIALGAVPASAAEAAPKPWWQLLSGQRPTNLEVAPDETEVQEVKTAAVEGSFAAAVEVGGEVIGCLGEGLGGTVGCFEGTGKAPVSSAAALQAMLEATPQYSAGEGVKVSGGPVGGAPFLIETPKRWAPGPVAVRVLPFEGAALGSASSEVISEGSGRLVITLTDLGNGPTDGTPVHIHDSLPSGAQGYGVSAFVGANVETEPLQCQPALHRRAPVHLRRRAAPL